MSEYQQEFKAGIGLSFIEKVFYYVINILTFGTLWISKIVIKKAIIEAIGSINFNIFIDNSKKEIKVKSPN